MAAHYEQEICLAIINLLLEFKKKRREDNTPSWDGHCLCPKSPESPIYWSVSLIRTEKKIICCCLSTFLKKDVLQRVQKVDIVGQLHWERQNSHLEMIRRHTHTKTSTCQPNYQVKEQEVQPDFSKESASSPTADNIHRRRPTLSKNVGSQPANKSRKKWLSVFYYTIEINFLLPVFFIIF